MKRKTAKEVLAESFREIAAEKPVDKITVPDAWRANYIDDLREVAVYGTLYLTMPTR